MKFKINRKKIIPDIREYANVLISVLISRYLAIPILEKLFPIMTTFTGLLDLFISVIIIVYFKNLIDISFNGREYF